MTQTILRIILALVAILAGLGLGLLLRRILVKRLKKTVLDDWLIQTLGSIVLVPPLVIAAAGAFDIITNRLDQLLAFWFFITKGIQPGDVRDLAAKFLGSLLIIVFSIGVSRTLSKITMRGIGEKRLDLNVRILIHRITYILVMLIAIFWVLALWQIAIELPVAVLGTLTVAITFSVQDILKDLIAGIYILLEHPFFIGDQISTANYTGQVINVELRATHLRLVSGEDITIPNSLVFGGVVINNSRYTERRSTILLSLPLADFSREETNSQIIQCVNELEEVLKKPEPVVSMSGITGENVELILRFWITNGQLATVTDVVYALRTTLPTANLSVKEAAGDV
jgi:small conductance mechanosensitive channel